MGDRTLELHFDFISPYSYLAWCRLRAFAPEHELRVVPRPTLLAALLDRLGHKGPGEIPPKRSYLWKDCIRGAAVLGVPLEPPASHPFNPLPTLRAALLDMEDDVRLRLVDRLYVATWAESRDVASPEVVADLCGEVGVPDVLARIATPAVKQRLFDANERALGRGVFGVPTMIVDDELFFGTDSFPHLERYLAGEDPVRPEDQARWTAIRQTATR